MIAGRCSPEFINALNTRGSFFQVYRDWNIETFMDLKGNVEYILCSTEKSHFTAAVKIVIKGNTVLLRWNEGIGINETEFNPTEMDTQKILEWVENGITSRMIAEAMALRLMLKSNHYYVND